MFAAPPVADTPSRPPRPNYGRIHAKPFPLDTFPLPPLIPHNPFSLLHIAYVYLSQLFFPTSSHNSNSVRGYFCLQTNSVHITDPASVRLLWERGFFGKGSLSRSEPTWLDREKKRLGLLANDTSEEYTQQRREERRRMKMERAKRERDVIEQNLTDEKLVAGDREATAKPELGRTDKEAEDGSAGFSGERESEELLSGGLQDSTASATLANLTIEEAGSMSPFAMPTNSTLPLEDTITSTHLHIHDEEHLQLASEEAFFLVYGLGILRVYDQSTKLPMTTFDILTVSRAQSHCRPLVPALLTPYDPFLLSYAAYHHFRSLGWVVRPGIKFAVDWLLYLRGPAFSHAEFAVVVLPAYRDGYWRETEEKRRGTAKREKRDWWWLHCLQRVQAQVRKGLVICWVEVPPPWPITGSMLSHEEREAAKEKGLAMEEVIDIGKLLKQYKIRDMTIKRWIPNRSRD
ncbi:MAG: hypothetical protein Q9217_003665 [Psora testacea]